MNPLKQLDMPNDVAMFRNSGFSIAMGNAIPEVKAQASAVTDSNENAGFAKAVRKFLLRPAGMPEDSGATYSGAREEVREPCFAVPAQAAKAPLSSFRSSRHAMSRSTFRQCSINLSLNAAKKEPYHE